MLVQPHNKHSRALYLLFKSWPSARKSALPSQPLARPLSPAGMSSEMSSVTRAAPLQLQNTDSATWSHCWHLQHGAKAVTDPWNSEGHCTHTQHHPKQANSAPSSLQSKSHLEDTNVLCLQSSPTPPAPRSKPSVLALTCSCWTACQQKLDNWFVSTRYPNSQYSKSNTGNARRDLVQKTTLTYSMTCGK